MSFGLKYADYARWEEITAEELRVAAKVARACGGNIMPAAADVWEERAKRLELEAEYPIRVVLGDGQLG